MQAPEELAFEIVRPALEEVLLKNRLSADYLSLAQNKGYYSILFTYGKEKGGSVVAQLWNKKRPYIAVPTYTVKNTAFSSVAENSLYSKCYLTSWDEIGSQTELLQTVLSGVIDNIPKDFDCCSRYMECSNAKECVHPDPDTAFLCGYRRVLRDGKIFYGANRNVK